MRFWERIGNHWSPQKIEKHIKEGCQPIGKSTISKVNEEYKPFSGGQNLKRKNFTYFTDGENVFVLLLVRRGVFQLVTCWKRSRK
jgi:hypothetical protein